MNTAGNDNHVVTPKRRLRNGTIIGSAVAIAGGSAAGLLALTVGTSAASTTFVVDTLDDGVANPFDCSTPVANSCSLRDALDAGTTDNDATVITFDPSLFTGGSATISLTDGDIIIYKGVTVTGPGSTQLTIDAHQASRVFKIQGSNYADDFALSGLTITNGVTPNLYQNGGGIYVEHGRNIVLNDMVFDGNSAPLKGKGGGAFLRTAGTLSITDSTFIDNQSYMGGGGLYSKSLDGVTLTRATISGNSSTNYRGGGATFVNTNGYQLVDLDIVDSTFSDNSTPDVGGGAAIVWQGLGSVSVTGSTVSGNSAKNMGSGFYVTLADSVSITDTDFTSNNVPTGGPLYGSKGGGAVIGNAGDVVITGGSFGSNTARDQGGGLGVLYSSSLSITGTTFDSNTSQGTGGGMWLYKNGDTQLTDVTISNNYANAQGAAARIWADTSSVTISNSTMSGNHAHSSGGALSLYNSYGSPSTFTINNSTITGNDSDDKGGAVLVQDAALVLDQSTVSLNIAGYFDGSTYVGGTGGVFLYGNATLTMSGTILSGNSNIDTGNQPSITRGADLSTDGGNTSPTAIQSSHSVLGEATVDGIFTDLGGTIYNTDPGVSALADNGGATQTMALLPNSVALDAGPDPVATFTGNEFDQRGTGYVRVIGTSVDIGAFEFGAGPPPTSSTTSTTTPDATSTTIAATDPEALVPAFTG